MATVAERLLHEVFQHGCRCIVVSDDPIFHWADRHDIGRGTTDHVASFFTNRNDFFRLGILRDNGRFV